MTLLGLLLTAGVLLRALPVAEVDGIAPATWLSILPALVAVLVAMVFRQLVLALVLGVLVGAFLAHGGAPVVAVTAGVSDFVLGPLMDGFNLRIIGFTLVLVAAVHVMAVSGGHAGIVAFVRARARSARATRTSTGLLGLLFFFDDYANAVVVGSTMRPLTDRMRISREKLAYLVDSTAAPVAGIALISTWIAFEVGLLQDLTSGPPLEVEGYTAFVAALPFRFYCFTALMFVFVSSIMGRDFGPMFRAEVRAARTGAVFSASAQPLAPVNDAGPAAGITPRAANTLVPLGAVLLLVVGGMLYFGRGAVEGAGLPFRLTDPVVWRLSFGDADSSVVLLLAALGGLLCAGAMALQHGVRLRDIGTAVGRGMRSMVLAITILVLAWGLKEVCETLHTASWLIGVSGADFPLQWLPLVTFVLAGVIAFATGTSWGTMGILLPVVVPLAIALGGAEPAGLVFLWMTIAAVLDGAIFGDHCSPISDTTVLSSIASGCDHLDHVRTQAPYALLAMVLASTLGYTAVAAGLSPIVALAFILGATVLLFRVVGRPLPAGEEASAPPAAQETTP